MKQKLFFYIFNLVHLDAKLICRLKFDLKIYKKKYYTALNNSETQRSIKP